jgi:REP element-mobilizing transposase RayT
MPYWQLIYHVVWATKNRLPLLTPEVEPVVHGLLCGKASGLEATIFAINGTADHVYMVVAIPPKIAVAKFIGQVKGVASTRFNKAESSPTLLYWQTEYGAFSFDGKRLPNYIRYVERQKEHHAQGSIIPVLERTDEGGVVRLVHDPLAAYSPNENEWQRELEAL